MKTFPERIALMNAMYKLPAHATPTITPDTAERLRKFKATLLDEVNEIDEIIDAAKRGAEPIELAVGIADLLGDIIVYCRSEGAQVRPAARGGAGADHGQQREQARADGEPIFDANGKFLKGPNYWKPEPKIRALLESIAR